MQDAKEEVRSRLNIEDVIAEYVPLKRAGRNFKGLSPFSQEKTPSFFVSPDKHIWHDFSSNKGGDIFSFVMEVEGIDFRAALELLARKAGVDLSLYQNSKSQGLAKKKRRLFEALDIAANYYQQTLVRNQHALEYVFKKRGLSKKVVQDFRIGYSPSTGDALTQFLLKKGFSAQELQDAGLSTKRYRGLGDMFRGRMMVPLMDGQGQVVGFTARLIDNDPKAPKYINTPQTLLYDKSRQVFGLHLAKEAIRTNDYAVVVEGNLDVVSSHQAGVAQVVATAGTAMTEYHLKALSRLSGNVRLSFDGDKAGLAATERAIPIAQNVGVNLSIITLPDQAKDPDELIQQSAEKWQQAIEAAQPVIDWVLDQYSRRYDLKTAEGKRLFSTQALDIIKALQDPVEREHYLKRVSEYTEASMKALETKLAGNTSKDAPKPRKAIKTVLTSVHPDEHSYQDNLLAIVASDHEARATLKKLNPDELVGEERQLLARYIAENPNVSLEEFIPNDLQTIETYVKVVLLKAEARYGAWSAQDRYIEAARLIRDVKTEHLKSKKNQLTEALRMAEESHNEKEAVRLMAEVNAIIKELGSAKK
jgi:DNA primase